ncbi:putative ankyrin repeat protein [Powai lake megavirus]|uniref:Putative ankyrin repeat protein n=1 Tax=Powai lake megavirus TaxID=1842663 RepID=A0A167R7D5_9VIRU|nr:putative ankyrin repeat protein [Powai lake megavirus]ANB50387.1 putative ankyrin repeat protein [Powai lake megavirus]
MPCAQKFISYNNNYKLNLGSSLFLSDNFQEYDRYRSQINTENINQIKESLYIACMYGIIRNVKYIFNVIKNSSDLNDKYIKHSNINECLCQAIGNGHTDIVKFLIEEGADINFDNSKPLLYAVKMSHYDIVEMLLKINTINIYNSYDIAKICCINNNCIILGLLIDNGLNLLDYYNDLLNFCFENKSTDCANLLIQYSCNNFEKISGTTSQDFCDNYDFFDDDNDDNDNDDNYDNDNDNDDNYDNDNDNDDNYDNDGNDDDNNNDDNNDDININ